jgi:hypothetical protein
VFWSVDWQSYEDAETAPSAPLDASRCYVDGLNSQTINQPYINRLNDWTLPYQDGLFLRNPERQINFTSSVAGLPTGAAAPVEVQGTLDAGSAGLPVLAGIYGADRNHNYLVDRGPVKKSTRMHATLIGRFNFYDPRLPITTR